jgi:hypothetical protein
VGNCDQNSLFNIFVPCPDTDGNVCTTARCDIVGNCDQNGFFNDFAPCPDTDGNVCTTARCDIVGNCDQNSFFNIFAPCPDTDGNVCTTARCDIVGNCDQNSFFNDFVPCPDTDGNVCTAARCDPGGNCDQSSFVNDFAPCPDTDGNDCTEARCDEHTCDQNGFIRFFDPCPDTDGNDCTEAECDGLGNCDQNAVVQANGASCDDGTACTEPDSCLNGICVGSNPVVCIALDQCHDVGICDPATGICSDPPLPDGTTCDDGDKCTSPDLCNSGICIPGLQECRVSISKKGSILYYSKIELRWDATGTLNQDTFLTIVNDYPGDVYVQWYFINGDTPLAAVFAGSPPVLIERPHNGWNWVDCATHLTENESSYMAMSSGLPLGCQPFGILDPGFPAGRPDPDGPTGERVLRGYAVAFAVDSAGNEISWNHLSGSVDIVNYANRSAWEYNAYAFQCVADVALGYACESENNHDVVAGAPAGILRMDGVEYDYVFDKLLFDFYAVGSLAFSQRPINFIQLDTDLTLFPVSVDLRQDSTGPIATKAKFDIWNQNEDGLSGTYRCITCWDQTLLSKYDAPNNFMIGNLHTNKGKARIDGMRSDVCNSPDLCCHLGLDSACFPAIDHPQIDPECSKAAALLGVSDKILHFSGRVTGRTDAGMTLVGQGQESATLLRDIIAPPDQLNTGAQGADGLDIANVNEASATPIRVPNRSQRRIHPGKE